MSIHHRISALFLSCALAAGSSSVSAATDEIQHIIGYGQSLSLGAFSTPVLSTTQQYNNLMFVGGARPWDSGTDAATIYGSLVPLVESASAGVYGETPLSGIVDMIDELQLSENGVSYDRSGVQYLASAPGVGSTTVAQLSYGTPAFNRLLQDLYYGIQAAQARNQHYRLGAVTWTQGESDQAAGTSQKNYIAAVEAMRQSIEGWANAFTGETHTLPLITYQTSSHTFIGKTNPTIAIAQWIASYIYPNIYLAAPTYMLEYVPNNLHLTNASSKWLGAYYGLAYKRIAIDGQHWLPLQPVGGTASGNVVTATFLVPQPPLVLDTQQVSNPGQYGFSLVTSSGTDIPLTSVQLAGPNTVRLTANRTIPAGAHLHYAYKGGTEPGYLTGPRGNLRDSQGDTIVFDPSGINKRMDNWCIIFDLAVQKLAQ